MAASGPSKIQIQFVGDIESHQNQVILRAADDSYTDDYLSTLGKDFMTSSIDVPDLGRVDCELWPQTNNRIGAYLGEPNVRAICVAMDDPLSFAKAQEAISTYKDRNIPIVILGTKCDQEPKRVSEERIRELTESAGASYQLVDAKTGTGIESMLQNFVESSGLKLTIPVPHDVQKYNDDIMAVLTRRSLELNGLIGEQPKRLGSISIEKRNRLDSVRALIGLANAEIEKNPHKPLDIRSLVSTMKNTNQQYASGLDSKTSGWKRLLGSDSKFAKMLSDIDRIAKPGVKRAESSPRSRKSL